MEIFITPLICFFIAFSFVSLCLSSSSDRHDPSAWAYVKIRFASTETLEKWAFRMKAIIEDEQKKSTPCGPWADTRTELHKVADQHAALIGSQLRKRQVRESRKEIRKTMR